jgi:hypothetical protein
MASSENKLLHNIDKRLAVVEERCKDLAEIKASLEKVHSQLDSLKVRVAGVSAAVAIIVSFLTKLIIK